MLRHMHQQHRGTFECHGRVVDHQWRIDRIASEIGQRVGNLRHLGHVHTHRPALVVNAEGQHAAVALIGQCHQMLGQAVLVVRQARFPVQFIDLMRHRVKALAQALQRRRDPDSCRHVIASC